MINLREQIDEALATLSKREQQVIQLRFGLKDGRSRTLEEVGKEFNVTEKRIYQIEAVALRKLRHPSRSRRLKDFEPEEMTPEWKLLGAIFGSSWK